LLRPTKEILISLGLHHRRTRSHLFSWFEKSGVYSAAIILVGIFGIVGFSGALLSKNEPLAGIHSFGLPRPTQNATKLTQGLPRSEPTRISIKRLGINTNIRPVGQNPDKTMQTPGIFENVAGWYKLGPSPGEVGPAVIVGHVDNYKGPSVFFRLKEAKAGDIIEISRKDGKTLKFSVTGLDQYSQNHFPTQKVYGNLDYQGLRLVTCGGTFNTQTGKYNENTVVFASLIKT